MRRGHVYVALLVGLVLALIALNLASVEDPEPSSSETTRQRSTPPQRETQPEDEVIEAEREAPRAIPTEAEEGATEEATEGPDSAPSAASALDCEHPFVPSARGEWRRYGWGQSGEEERAELHLESLGVRELRAGRRVARWRVRVLAENGEALAETETLTQCRTGEDAEEPWFGVLERSLGLTLTDEPGRWRWPTRLSMALRFEGVATFDPRGGEMVAPEGSRADRLLVRRRHTVIRREEVTVPAGTFEAWRVDYDEEHTFGDRGEAGRGQLWVAEEVGLVKSEAENSRGVRQTLELTGMPRP